MYNISDKELFELFVEKYQLFVKSCISNEDTKFMNFCYFITQIEELRDAKNIEHIMSIIKPSGDVRILWWDWSDYKSRLEYLDLLMPVYSTDGKLEKVLLSDTDYTYKFK